MEPVTGVNEVLRLLATTPEGAGRHILLDMINLEFSCERVSYFDRSELPDKSELPNEVFSLGLCRPEIYRNVSLLLFLAIDKLRNELSILTDLAPTASREARSELVQNAIHALTSAGKKKGA